MSHEEVLEMMGEMGLPFAYDHFVEGEAPKPPFLVFLYPKAVNFAADGYVKAKTGNQTTKATYEDWYKTVYLPAPKTETPAAEEGQG